MKSLIRPVSGLLSMDYLTEMGVRSQVDGLKNIELQLMEFSWR